MKNLLYGILLFVSSTYNVPLAQKENIVYTQTAENLIIVTLDGFRWQEVFLGADSLLLSNQNNTPDISTMQLLYGGSTPEERRKKLLPFFWNVLVNKGQLYGNRLYDNKMSVANPYKISYPGYSEMISGNVNLAISTNKKRNNPNLNVFEHLNTQPGFSGRVAVFSSWNVFPHIFNSKRNELPVYSGYLERSEEEWNEDERVLYTTQRELVYEKEATRYDQLTFIAAKEHLKKNKPRVLFLGLGETDEMAHANRYDLYLEKASQADRMLAELWHWIQTTEGYKDNTVLLITTDHGRGKKPYNWSKHGFFVSGSDETWMGIMGPGITNTGEMKEPQQLFQKQIAATIAKLLGEKFEIEEQSIATAIALH